MTKTKSKLFPDRITRYKVNAFKISQLRQQSKLSVEQFAEAVGWTLRYQYKIEEGFCWSLSEKTVNEICQTFERQGIVVRPEDFGKPEFRYTIHPEKIYIARKAKGFWLEECARLCGWSLQYQQNLESGKVKTVTEEAANILIKALK